MKFPSNFLRHSLLIVAAVLVLLLWIIRPNTAHDGTDGQKLINPQVVLAPSPPASRPLRLVFTPGATAMYDYRCYLQPLPVAQSNFQTGGLPGNTVITLHYHLHVLAVTDKEIVLASAATEVEAVGDGQPQAELCKLLTEHGSFLRLTPDGHRIGFALQGGNLSEEDANIVQILNSQQIVLPAGEENRWIADEVEFHGITSKATYTQTGGLTLKKSRALGAIPAESSIQTFLSESNISITLSPILWFDKWQGDEIMEMKTGSQPQAPSVVMMKLRQETSISRTQSTSFSAPHWLQVTTATEALRALDRAASGTQHSLNASTSVGAKAARRRLYEKYHSMKLDTVWDELISTTQTSNDLDAALPALNALRDWLIVHPEGAAEVGIRLHKPELSDEATSRIIHALELSGNESPMSQHVLAKLLTDDILAHERKLQAATATNSLNPLDPSVDAAQRKILSESDLNDPKQQELLDNVFLARSALCREQPELADAVRNEIEVRLNPANADIDPRDRALAFAAAANGNFLDTTYRDAAIAHLDPTQQTNENVRVASVEYLKLQLITSSNEARPALEAALNDPSPAVSAAARNALGLVQPEIP